MNQHHRHHHHEGSLSCAAGPLVLEPEDGHHRRTLLAAYLFTVACLLSLCLYWCVQRCVYRYVADVMKAELADPGARDVEDFFHELARNSFPRAPPLLPVILFFKLRCGSLFSSLSLVLNA
jgi:hypothetical protein